MSAGATARIRVPLTAARRDGAIGAVGVVVALVVWELAARALEGGFALAAPTAVVASIVDNAGLLGRALAATGTTALIGFVIGNGAAVALGALAAAWPRSERTITGLALIVVCLPLVATAPLLRVLLGQGDGPSIALAALSVYYTTLIPLLVGLRAVPSTWLDLVQVAGRGPLTALVAVRARASLPYLAAGLQIAAPAAFLGAMVGEFTGAERGLGVLTIRAARDLDVDLTWALATIAAVISMAAYGLIGIVARRLAGGTPPTILAAPRLGAGRGRLRATVVGAGSAVLAAVVLWWGGIIAFDITPFVARTPIDVIGIITGARDGGETRDALLGALGETAVFVVPGYLAGLVAGLALAILVVLVPGTAGAVMPIAIALRSVPIVTTVPLIVLLLGRGPVGAVAITAVMVFFPTLVACLHGLRRAPGQVLDVMEVYATPSWRVLLRARIPAMLPAFFAAARMGVPSAVLAVTAAEWLATGTGIGALMALSASLSDYDVLAGAVVIVTAISAVGYALVGAVETRVLARYAPEQSG